MADETPQVSTEDKIKLLTDWIALIENDLTVMQKARDEEFGIYQKQKALYDGWLAKRYRRVTKIEKEMTSRRKEIDRIRGEIEAIQSRPPPGILPELPKKRTYTKKSVVEETPDLSKVLLNSTESIDNLTSQPIIFTDEERRQMEAEAKNS